MTQGAGRGPSRALGVRALILLALFAVVHLAGLRQYLPLLCGSPAPGGYSRLVQAAFCVTYLLFYFGAVLVAPVFLIAAGLLGLR